MCLFFHKEKDTSACLQSLYHGLRNTHCVLHSVWNPYHNPYYGSVSVCVLNYRQLGGLLSRAAVDKFPSKNGQHIGQVLIMTRTCKLYGLLLAMHHRTRTNLQVFLLVWTKLFLAFSWLYFAFNLNQVSLLLFSSIYSTLKAIFKNFPALTRSFS